MKKPIFFLIICFLFFTANDVVAQLWTPIEDIEYAVVQGIEQSNFQNTEGKLYRLHGASFERLIFMGSVLEDEVAIELPLPNGEIIRVELKVNSLMSAKLQKKYPTIKSWTGMYEGQAVQVDYGVHGLHAMLFLRGQTVYIDPIRAGGDVYLSYNSTDFKGTKVREGCRYNPTQHLPKGLKNSGLKGRTEVHPSLYTVSETTSTMKTFRLALACTGEYAIFHGGTKEGALSAMITTMNRVNGIYRRDLGVQMQLIAENDKLIFLDPESDPYNNYDSFDLLDENQATVDDIIGNENYDIGHVFSTGRGGVAFLQSVCNRWNKAKGVTGSNSPVGDPYDIDYVAHEMGHQFGANHSFNNSCSGNRNDNTAYEPGSGNTIMGYAGVCRPNIQNNSNSLFHGGSLMEMNNFIETLSCPEVETYENSAPSLSVAEKIINIPAKTPFYVEVEAADPDGDSLTYAWEQYDVAIVDQPPTGEQGRGPLFKGFMPDESPRRYFPSLQALGSSSPSTWEVVSSVSRGINLGVTVRDNHPDAPRTAQEFIQVMVLDVGDGFYVTFPTGLYYVPEKSILELNWETGNTEKAPISSESVDIFLLRNSGYTMYDTIAMDVPNNGAYDIAFDYPENTAYRILIQGHERAFFNMSGIVVVREGMDIAAIESEKLLCPGAPDTLEFDIPGKYKEEIDVQLKNLSSGMSYRLLSENVNGGGIFKIVVEAEKGVVSPGEYDIKALFNVGDIGESVTVNYTVGMVDIDVSSFIVDSYDDTRLELSWVEKAGDVNYRIQQATESSYEAILLDTLISGESSLVINAVMGDNYLRIRAESACEVTGWVSGFIESECMQRNLLTKEGFDSNLWEEESGDGVDILRKEKDKYLAYLGTQGGFNEASLSTMINFDESIKSGIISIPYFIEGGGEKCDAELNIELHTVNGNVIARKVVSGCSMDGETGMINLSTNCIGAEEAVQLKITSETDAHTSYYVVLKEIGLTTCVELCLGAGEKSENITKSESVGTCVFGASDEFQYLFAQKDSMIVGINTQSQNLGTYRVSTEYDKYDEFYASKDGVKVAVMRRSFKMDNIEDCHSASSFTLRLFFTEDEFQYIRDRIGYVHSLDDLGVSLIANMKGVLNQKEKQLLRASIPTEGVPSNGILTIDVGVPESNGILLLHALKDTLADIWYGLKASPEQPSILTEWQIKLDENIAGLSLERSLEKEEYTTVYEKGFDGAEVYPLEMSYRDLEVVPKTEYYYRIKIINKAGEIYYSPPVRAGIDISSTKVSQLSEFKIFPNPHRDYVFFKNDYSGAYTVEIYNTYGSLLDRKQFRGDELRYNSEKLSRGLYYLKVYESGKFIGVKSFIKM